MKKKPKPKEWLVPKDLDKECIALCVAMNRMPGIDTTCSCCGHGNSPYHIFFQPRKPADMLPLLFYMQKCHLPLSGKWRVEAYTDCAGMNVFWMLEGPSGVDAYTDSETIAAAICRELNPGTDATNTESNVFVHTPDRPEAKGTHE